MYICVPIEKQKIHRGVEQLVARRAHNPKVVGSSPAPATKEPFSFSGRLFYFMKNLPWNTLSTYYILQSLMKFILGTLVTLFKDF